MNPERREAVKRLFQDALERSPVLSAEDKLVFNMSEVAGNIWMAEVPEGR